MSAAGSYLTAQRTRAGFSIRDVAARIGTDPHVSEHDRCALIEAVERDPGTATVHTVAALRSVYAFSVAHLVDLIQVAADARRAAVQ